MAEVELTERTIRWSKSTDQAVSDFLASESENRQEFSEFIEDAVRWRLFDQLVQTVKARNSDLGDDEIQRLVDQAVCEVRRDALPQAE